jgi:hypothetical protein
MGKFKKSEWVLFGLFAIANGMHSYLSGKALGYLEELSFLVCVVGFCVSMYYVGKMHAHDELSKILDGMDGDS